MLKARPDRKSPPSPSENNSAGMIGSRFADRIKAQAKTERRTHDCTRREALRQKILATGEPSTHDEG